jgi:hypothetical protein
MIAGLRACPWRARSDGDQQWITVTQGHATSVMTCGSPDQNCVAADLLSSKSFGGLTIGIIAVAISLAVG